MSFYEKPHKTKTSESFKKSPQIKVYSRLCKLLRKDVEIKILKFWLFLFILSRGNLHLRARCLYILLCFGLHPGRTHRQAEWLMAGCLGRKKLFCIRMELGCKFARQKLVLGCVSADNVIVVLPASGYSFCCWSAQTARSQRGTSPAGQRWHKCFLKRQRADE